MKKSLKPGPPFWYLGGALTIFGIVFLTIDKSSDQLLLVGLYVLFVSNVERVDERTRRLKTSSTHIAFLLGYVIKVLVNGLFTEQLISFELTKINHFLILVFALALVIYYCRLYITVGKMRKN